MIKDKVVLILLTKLARMPKKSNDFARITKEGVKDLEKCYFITYCLVRKT